MNKYGVLSSGWKTTNKYRANRRTRRDTLFESLSFANSRVRRYPFVYQFILRLELSHRRSVLWALSKHGVFENKSKIFVMVSRCYGTCEIIRFAMFRERLHSSSFRNKRFGELSRSFGNLFFFNRPFYLYGGHIELIRFKEYYRMPRGHEHISCVFSSAFQDIFS